MKSRKLVTAALLASVAAWIAFENLGSAAPPVRSPMSQDAGEAPGPGPEHKLLAKWAGMWDCEVETSFVPGAPPEKSKGGATYKLACGGLWLVSDFEGTIMGAPFGGHGVVGFDPLKKKYVLNWVDSMTATFSLGEGTFDEKTKTMTMHVKGSDPAGGAMNWRQTEVWTDDNTFEWTMLQAGPDGKESQAMRIVYRRKK